MLRRKEFEVNDQKSLEEVLKTAEIGNLAFNGPEGFPRITPLNYVFDGRILWHGAIAGERFECLQRDPRATFCAVSAQSYVPSFLLSEENATNATAAFKSVIVRGKCQVINDPQEKCAILNTLMDRYQPEGKYRKLTPDDPMYLKVLAATGVFALIVEEMTGKFKFAQNKPEEARRKIASWLMKRGLPGDRVVAEEILKTMKG
jgi:nitroimidazol reductase NimA-like FMN-containing flavoprotein (pyridoxamine 5'-phosphate oxidase superfamily)